MLTTFIGDPKEYYVDYMLLKWGNKLHEGSDHITGGRRREAEVDYKIPYSFSAKL